LYSTCTTDYSYCVNFGSQKYARVYSVNTGTKL